jgi:hypothetical protein
MSSADHLRPNNEGLPVLAQELASMLGWMRALRAEPLQAACTFYAAVERLLDDNRAVPQNVVEAANRCFQAAIDKDPDKAAQSVDDAIVRVTGCLS